MSHLPIDHSDVPIRLFKSDFMEFFSHISPITVTVIWLPVAVYFLVSAILKAAPRSLPGLHPRWICAGTISVDISRVHTASFCISLPCQR